MDLLLVRSLNFITTVHLPNFYFLFDPNCTSDVIFEAW